MFTKQSADDAVQARLREMEREMDLFGSALPENKDRPSHHLAVISSEEHEFGWVYFYSSREFAETGDFQYSLVGNGPLVFNRKDGTLYAIGSAVGTLDPAPYLAARAAAPVSAAALKVVRAELANAKDKAFDDIRRALTTEPGIWVGSIPAFKMALCALIGDGSPGELTG